METKNFRYENVVALVNYHSKNADHGRERLAELQEEIGIPIEAIESSKDRRQNVSRIQDQVAENDLLITVGGDGTVNDAVHALSSGPLKGLRVPLLIIGGGNGNDIVHMIRDPRKSVKQIIEDGKTVAIHPIKAVINDDKSERTRYAAGYLSLGATAEVASTINQPDYRKSRYQKVPVVRDLHEMLTTGQALSSTEPFTVVQDGIKRQLVERTFANGPRIAKYFHPPVRITDQELFVIDIEAEKRLNLAKWIGKVALPATIGKMNGFRLPGGDNLTFQALGNHLKFHADGEAEELAYETNLTVTQDSVPFYVLGNIR